MTNLVELGHNPNNISEKMWEFLIGFALGVYFWRSLILNSVTCVNLMDGDDAQCDKES